MFILQNQNQNKGFLSENLHRKGASEKNKIKMRIFLRKTTWEMFFFQKIQGESFSSKNHLENMHLQKFKLKDLLNNDDFFQKVSLINF